MIDLSKLTFQTKQIQLNITQEGGVDLQSTLEMSKDLQLDLATQLPLRIAGFDPKLIMSFAVGLLSIINAIAIRTLTAYIITAFIIIASVVFTKFARNSKQFNF